MCTLEKEMATHSSILTWRIPWTESPGGLQSMGSQRVGHDWVTKQACVYMRNMCILRLFGVLIYKCQLSQIGWGCFSTCLCLCFFVCIFLRKIWFHLVLFFVSPVNFGSICFETRLLGACKFIFLADYLFHHYEMFFISNIQLAMNSTLSEMTITHWVQTRVLYSLPKFL